MARWRSDHQALPELFDPPMWDHLALRFKLTRRQLEVAKLLCRGCTNPEIAKLLHLATDSVRPHIRQLFERLMVRRRVQIVIRLVVEARSRSDGQRQRGQRPRVNLGPAHSRRKRATR